MINLLGFIRIQQSEHGNCCSVCNNKPDALWFACINGGIKNEEKEMKELMESKNRRTRENKGINPQRKVRNTRQRVNNRGLMSV